MAAAELYKSVVFAHPNLVGYWRLESDSSDSKGSNNGTDTDITYSAGKYGNCAVFNGSTSKIVKSSPSGLPTGSTSRTVNFWINPDSNSGYQVGVSMYASSGQGFHIGTTTTSEALFSDGVNAGNNLTLAVNPTVGVWNMITFVCTSVSYRVYLNGVSIQTGSWGTAINTGTLADLTFGGRTSTAQFLDGKLDDISIFSAVISDDYIKELYEGRFIGEAYPQAGLVGGWHLNGSSTDFSGNNNHGTDTAITYSQANGKFGQGAGFNGSSSYITLATTGLPTSSTARSISLWANFSAQPSTNSQMYMVNWGTASSNALCAFIYSDSSGTKKLNLSGYANDASINYTLSSSVWYHLVATYSGTTVTFYVNGNSVGTATITAFNTGATGAMMGRPYWDPSAYLNAKLDEVRIFNVAKSALWVRQQYAIGSGKYY